jgi:hypothetical protein
VDDVVVLVDVEVVDEPPEIDVVELEVDVEVVVVDVLVLDPVTTFGP